MKSVEQVIVTETSAVVVFNDGTWVLPAEHKFYEAVTLLSDMDDYDAIMELYNVVVGKAITIVANVNLQKKKEIRMPASLKKAMGLKQGQYLSAFWEKLKQNKNMAITNELFDVITSKFVTIQDDGNLVVYALEADGKNKYLDFLSFKEAAMVSKKMEAEMDIFEYLINPKHIIDICVQKIDAKRSFTSFVAPCAIGNTFVRKLEGLKSEKKPQPVKGEVKAFKEVKVIKTKSPVKKTKMSKLIGVRPPGKSQKKPGKIGKVKEPLVFDLAVNSYRNRIGLRKKMLEAISVYPGDRICCEYTRGKIIIRKEETGQAIETKFSYLVNESGSLKMSYQLILDSNLENKSMSATVIGDTIVVKQKEQ